MAMTINTNVMSLNAQRSASANQASLATTMQRLSSGLRVNSAKDDAAGLAIATRMDSQVRGMSVAVRNANDGISLAQTAEAGMSTITDMLQRMRELAVQGANSTNTTGAGGDIDKLNDEYAQLGAEIQRTLGAVQFNGKTLLSAATSTDFTFQVGANSGTNQRITISGTNINIGSGNLSAVFGAGTASGLNISAASANANAVLSAIDNAISAVNTARAKMGAVQSRFENTINFLQAAIENQAAAKGRIMDADFASETSKLSRAQILQQAGTAMVAQANQLPQGVLALLR